MDRACLPSVMVSTAERRSLAEALGTIVEGLAACHDVVLARIWLVDSSYSCQICGGLAPNDREPSPCLHLLASAGNPSQPGPDYARLDGSSHRISLSSDNPSKISQAARSGTALLIRNVEDTDVWLANPDWIKREGVKTIAAQPLSVHGRVLGVLALFDRTPLSEEDLEWLHLFANQAAVSLVNARALDEILLLQAQLGAENARLQGDFRDLFEEAPIAYVHEDLESRFIRANRAAVKILGLDPERISDTIGKSLVAPRSDDVRREAFESLGRGSDAGGLVIELRRKDNGKPVWIQWWSSPGPTGKYTRTMMLDITERILLEQEQERLRAQNEYLRAELQSEQKFGKIVGESPELRKVIQQVQMVAPTDASVLITGESGTGKEVIAQAIHDQSPRNARPLIKVNCGAVPDALFESEFFGHVRGAFTGALRDKPGRFELADGGTLFLDEIGEVPLAMQAKLLRALQEHEIQRVGDTRTRKIDVRIIAATNRDLLRESAAGRFRQDLFYRLSVFPIQIPPLRERRQDIPPLVSHFLEQSAGRMKRPTPRVTAETMAKLAGYDWPGNVRELQNAIERAVIQSQTGQLDVELTEASGPAAASREAAPLPTSALLTREQLKRQERDSIAAALARADGKVFGAGGAAELLGMKPTTLSSRMKALGLGRKSQDG